MAGWNVGYTPSNPAANASPLFIPPPAGAVQGGEPLGFGDPRVRNGAMPQSTPYNNASQAYQLPPAPAYGGWPTPGYGGQTDPAAQRAPSAPPTDSGFVSTGWHRPPQNTPQPTQLYTPSQYNRSQNLSGDSDQSSSRWGSTPRGQATHDPWGTDHSPWQQDQQPPSDPWAAGERTADAWGASNQTGWGDTPNNNDNNGWGAWGEGADPGAGAGAWGGGGGGGGWGSSSADASPQANNNYLSATAAFGVLNRSTSHEKPKKRKHRTRPRASSDPAWIPEDPHSQPPGADLQQNNYGTFQPSPYGAPGFSSSSLTSGGASPLWPGYPPESDYNELNVAKRPRDWREEYSVRGGINFRVPLSPSRSDIREISDPVKRLINPMLAYHSTASVTWNISGDPFLVGPISFPYLKRQHNDLDYAQLASTPGAPVLRLFHPRYPWYIDVRSSHENGVTVGDVLMQVFMHLMTPITPRHYYNEDVAQRERDLLGLAYQKRTRSDPRTQSQGILKIDFLGMEGLLRFVGLSRTRSGMWEMKLKKVE